MKDGEEIRFIEMFAGIGGFRYGLERANNICGKYRNTKKGNKRTGTSFESSQATSKSLQSEGDISNPIKPGDSGQIQHCCGSNNSKATQKERDQKSRSNMPNINGESPTLRRSKPTYRCVWSNENNKYATKIYRKNFGDKELVEVDIREIQAKTIPAFELLTAGFPCQAFSVAGKRKATQEARGTLFTHIIRVASAKRPKLLLLENVKGILSSESGRTFAIILRTLANLGYLLEWQVLNSKHFGVPQNRERVFIIGHLRGEGGQKIFPIGQNGEKITEVRAVARTLQGGGHSGGLHSNMTGLISKSVRSGGRSSLDRHMWDLIQVGNVDQKGHNSLWGRVYSPKGIAPNLNAKGGGLGAKTGLIVQPCLTPDRLKRRQCGRRFKEDGEPMFTLTGQDIHGVALVPELEVAHCLNTEDSRKFKLNPSSQQKANLVQKQMRIRRLTPTECERLQGFPDGWTEWGIDENGKKVRISDTQRYKCLGNAVTTNVIEFLGRRIRESIIV